MHIRHSLLQYNQGVYNIACDTSRREVPKQLIHLCLFVMPFVVVQIPQGCNILKDFQGLLVPENITLSELYHRLASGELDKGLLSIPMFEYSSNKYIIINQFLGELLVNVKIYFNGVVYTLFSPKTSSCNIYEECYRAKGVKRG